MKSLFESSSKAFSQRPLPAWGLACQRGVGALATLATMVLVACGPGTGGTGVGPLSVTNAISGTYLSASSGIKVSLPAFATGSGTATGQVLTPSAESNLVVVFETQRISLNSACLSFTSTGVRLESDGQLQIDGLVRVVATGTADASASLPATLVARVDGSALQVSLRTPEGVTLASFGTSVRLADGASPAPVGTCVLSSVPN